MRTKLKKILSQLLGVNFLARTFMRLLASGLHSFRAEIRKRLVAWARKAAVWLFVVSLARCALFFGLSALALYLNALLGSSYQGFLIVSGGCVVLLLLLLSVRWPGKNS